METSLHRELKKLYADDERQIEVSLGNYRIDVVSRDQLIEIQHGPLAAIRKKVQSLLEKHKVLVVKPIVARKLLVKLQSKGGREIGRRRSPKHGSPIDLFAELVYFTGVFPHKRLSLDLVLVDVEEFRYPGHGRRRRWRKNDYQVEDQKLSKVHKVYHLQSADDLRKILRCRLPSPFHTGHLAKALGVERFVAQQIAYCFRHMGTARQVGKQRNTRLYEFTGSCSEAA